MLHRCVYDFLFKIILPLFIIGIKVTQRAYENIYEDVNGLLQGMEELFIPDRKEGRQIRCRTK